MKRFNKFMDKHPLLAICLGYLVVIALTLAIVPADPPSIAQALHERVT